MKTIFALTALALTFGAVPAFAQTPEPIGVPMKTLDGQSKGTIRLTETPHGVLVDGDLSGMPDGEYALHFHAAGRCEGNFDSAGAHHNPTNKEHGFEAANGPHAGDMANVFVVNGVAKFQQFNPMVRFTSGDAALNDTDGTSIMVHGSPDDYQSQPSGNAGSRMACGVVYAAP